MQSAKCAWRRSCSAGGNDRSLYAASDSASAHSGVEGPGCARIARRRIASSGLLFLVSGVTSSRSLYSLNELQPENCTVRIVSFGVRECARQIDLQIARSPIITQPNLVPAELVAVMQYALDLAVEPVAH